MYTVTHRVLKYTHLLACVAGGIVFALRVWKLGPPVSQEPSANDARKFHFQNFKASFPHSPHDFAASLPRLSSYRRSHRLHRLPTYPFLRTTLTLTKNAMCVNGKKSLGRTPEGIEIFSPQFFQVFQHSSVSHLQIASPGINFCAELSISRFV